MNRPHTAFLALSLFAASPVLAQDTAPSRENPPAPLDLPPPPRGIDPTQHGACNVTTTMDAAGQTAIATSICTTYDGKTAFSTAAGRNGESVTIDGTVPTVMVRAQVACRNGQIVVPYAIFGMYDLPALREASITAAQAAAEATADSSRLASGGCRPVTGESPVTAITWNLSLASHRKLG